MTVGFSHEVQIGAIAAKDRLEQKGARQRRLRVERMDARGERAGGRGEGRASPAAIGPSKESGGCARGAEDDSRQTHWRGESERRKKSNVGTRWQWRTSRWALVEEQFVETVVQSQSRAWARTEEG